MKFLFVVFLWAQFSTAVTAQEKLPVGCYMSFEEVRQKKPSKKCNLQVDKKTKGEVFMLGGNDFIIYAEDKSIKDRTIRNEMWAYSTGYKLYLNGHKLHLLGGYVEVVDQGRFLVFYGSATVDDGNEALLGGGIAAGATALERYLYAIDIKTGVLHTATKKYLNEVLNEFPDLKNKYEAEGDKESEKTIMTYLNLCNQTK